MERRMLINAVHPEQTRIAIVDGTELVELEIESSQGKKLKGNIYKAKIARVEPSLQAAFLDIGSERNGFLQIHDVHPSCYRQRPQKRNKGRADVRIQDVLEAGQELIVQVAKEEREMKGASLTTFLSLPGRYTVLMPGSERGGVSRKIADRESRHRLKALLEEIDLPDSMGLIIRTAGLNRSLSELSRDVQAQLKIWEHVQSQAKSAPCPTAIFKDDDLSLRIIRDYFTPDVREIIIDDHSAYEHVRDFVAQTMPRYKSRVKLYESDQPLFTYYGLEEQVVDTTREEVKLPSGGSIVIEALEALVAIDVNSGKATTGRSIEETAFETNLEAADTIAKQLRLRDLGGLIVVDFIDMHDERHRAGVEQRMNQSVKGDKARVEVGRISKFGLLEMSRQRLKASLSTQSHAGCPVCKGSGKVRTPEFVGLEVLRKIQSAVIVGQVTSVRARLSPQAALFLLNTQRRDLSRLEDTYQARVFIVPDGRLAPDEYEFEVAGTRTGAPPPPTLLAGSAPRPRIDVTEQESDPDADASETPPSRKFTDKLEGNSNKLKSYKRTRVHKGKKPKIPDVEA